ncbi:Uncharacterised protein [[Clostridium] sordellii]|uniref:hypothetical protein n=1 Tax=Paraclostridium sordellii TaxID=1505 RepID=UPI0005EA033E|nr:hypothetical protein [Paeniclostridium sordellii]CEQ26501.1 Uncharacterised protein [[Clostridium] sordellii] [Paeniclostridium sordellii]
MKKILSLVMSLIIVLGMVGCNNGKGKIAELNNEELKVFNHEIESQYNMYKMELNTLDMYEKGGRPFYVENISGVFSLQGLINRCGVAGTRLTEMYARGYESKNYNKDTDYYKVLASIEFGNMYLGNAGENLKDYINSNDNKKFEKYRKYKEKVYGHYAVIEAYKNKYHLVEEKDEELETADETTVEEQPETTNKKQPNTKKSVPNKKQSTQKKNNSKNYNGNQANSNIDDVDDYEDGGVKTGGSWMDENQDYNEPEDHDDSYYE